MKLCKCFTDLFSNFNSNIIETNKIMEIKNQIEFYMSYPNLKHNHNLRKIIKKSNNGFIPIKIFLNFNKIKFLKINLDELILACEKSEKLEFNKIDLTIKNKELNNNNNYFTYKLIGFLKNENYNDLKFFLEKKFNKILRLSMHYHRPNKINREFNGIIFIDILNEINITSILYKNSIIQIIKI